MNNFSWQGYCWYLGDININYIDYIGDISYINEGELL